MTQEKRIHMLINYLLEEMPMGHLYARQFGNSLSEQFRLFRSLVNIRPPRPVDEQFLHLQDELLKEEITKKGITELSSLTPKQGELYLWQGDITTLKVDAIVNAANSGMTGCYCPCHGCIDNAVHTFAGVELRLECSELINNQGYEEPTGQAKITGGYNLPSKYVIHTVGPIVGNSLTKQDEALLASCYTSCLKLACENELNSIAFCCISTGEFHFPNRRAAEIAIKACAKMPGLW